ncbi:NAD-dependent epimerase/dehydratase family protein [Spongiivirga citrea]|uniref:NAD-dependent epimerase/dehydratase family protein n=1 Tax=Spongiivirga citrea TaxID=1481457 RepID=A0A6M0CR19_9FLAO|nr:NAD-dependent epimerase/dehydratase family protein [Spongiivirga citrea]NER17957.1 NAD-dependent epimerase/dehydratase family protein [Spongiivirga citrea]
MTKSLIIGACGQIGSELTLELRKQRGTESVVATDIREGSSALMNSGIFEILDVMDKTAVINCVEKHEITEVYLMAAMLSATAEKYPKKAWDLNMTSLSHILDLAHDGLISKIFWPSSIAVFGPTTPKKNTPQVTIMEPTSVYGITKLAGERWCDYYYHNHNIDVRSIRYPGLISWKTDPGGGTTDYAVEIYHKALTNGHYNCFLKEDTELPMMYMNDAIKATIAIMEADFSDITVWASYNLGGVSFNPQEIAVTIQKHIPGFSIDYQPDFRQKIADSWPNSIDDQVAFDDWGWQHEFDLDAITKDMLLNLKIKKGIS